MATIKDIAKIAGVSHGTVSNVLNKKGNISAEKIELVENAAKKLGYRINESAKTLRAGSTNILALILPNITSDKYSDLYKSINQFALSKKYTVELYITDFNPILEKEAANKALVSRAKSIIVISCIENKIDFYSEEYFKFTKIIFADQDCNINKNNIYNIIFDNKKISEDLEKYILTNNYNNILFFSDRSIFSDDISIYHYLKNNPNINIQYESCDSLFNLNKSFEIFNDNNNYDLIITSSLEKAQSIYSTFYTLKEKTELLNILAITSSKVMPSQDFKFYQRNYNLMGKIAAQIALDINNNDIFDYKNKKILKNTGLNFKFNNISKISSTVNILMLESPTSNVLIQIKPYLEKLSGLNINIVKYNYDEFSNIFNSPQTLKMFDLIRMDMAWLSEIGKDIFMPLDLTGKDFSTLFDKFIPCIDEFSLINNKKYCLPFDPSSQLLLYRKDIFENAKIKRMYFEQYREELTVPTNFKQYAQVERFFTKKFNSRSPVNNGSTVCTGSSLTCACEFLPRFFDFNGKIFKDGKININTEESYLAFKNYQESISLTNNTNYSFWREVVSDFANGNSAMMISFSNHFTNVLNSKYSNVIGNIGYSNVPGNNPLIGGGVLGISKHTKQLDASFELLKLIYSDEIACLITMLGGSSPNKKVYTNDKILEMFPWIESIPNIIKNNTRRFLKYSNHTNISTIDFEYTLGNALRNAISGTTSIENALSMTESIINEKITQTNSYNQ